MNKNQLNSVTLNGGSYANQEINLGDVSVLMWFMYFERTISTMQGATGITFESLSDITKMSQIGVCASGITFSHYSDVLKFSYVGIGEATANMVFIASASIFAYTPIGVSVSGMAFTVNGTPSSVLSLSGDASIEFETASYVLQSTKLLPIAKTNISFDAIATINSIVNVPNAQTDINFSVDASIVSIVYVSGETGITFNTSANLFNNPNAYDPVGHVFNRPYEERVMVRQ